MNEVSGFVVGCVVGFGLAVVLMAVSPPSPVEPADVAAKPSLLELAHLFCDYEGVKDIREDTIRHHLIGICGDDRRTILEIRGTP